MTSESYGLCLNKEYLLEEDLGREEKVGVFGSINCIMVQSSAIVIIRFGQNLWKKKIWKKLDKGGFLDLHFSLKLSCPCEFCSLKHASPEMLFLTGSLCIIPSSFYIQIIASGILCRSKMELSMEIQIWKIQKRKPLPDGVMFPNGEEKEPCNFRTRIQDLKV